MSGTTKNSFLFLVYLGGLSIIGFLATDMYLPAFDTMRIDLGTSKQNISASLSLFLGGFAIAQLIWGPISDKYGKPKSILMGLILFSVASLCIYFTHNVTLLLSFRLLQAIGVCAAAVNWQALVIERYPAGESNKIFATIMPLVALSPALAPLVGVFLLDHFSWRAIFVALTGLAVLLIIYTFTLEDRSTLSDPKALSKDNNGQSYLTLFKSKRYVGNILIYAFCSGSFFAWLTGSPFFLKELGYSESEIGFSFVPQTIAFMFGGYGYRFISGRISGDKLMPWLLLLYSISLLSILIICLIMVPTLTILLVPFCAMALANGAGYPIAVARALQVFPNNLGKAVALQNTVQLGTCFLASFVVSIFSKDALLATAYVMAATVPPVWIAERMTRK